MKSIEKDGITYLFASKFPKLNNPYAISKEDKEFIDKEYLTSLAVLRDSYIEIDGVKQVSLLDISFGANYSPRKYKAELWNRVDTLKNYAKDKGFDTPVFITLTPPTTLKPLKQIKLKGNRIKLVDNPNYTGDSDYIKSARDYITNTWRKFLSQQIFKDIKREFGDNIIYLRTYEPFMDGTPHCHILAFIPAKFKERFVKLAKNYFKTRTDIKTEFNGEIGGVIAYILKYIFKSFINSKTKEFEYISYWYLLYKIRRFSCSRTILPMYIFRRIKKDEKFRDLKELTNLYKDGMISIDLIADNKRVLETDKLLFKDYKIDTIIVSMIDEDNIAINHIAYKKSSTLKVNIASRNDYADMGRVDFKSLRKKLDEYREEKIQEEERRIKSWYEVPIDLRPFAKMTDMDLMHYYKNYSHRFENPQRIAIMENELLKRDMGSVTGEKDRHDLNDIESLFFKFYNKGFYPIPF